MSHSVHSAVSSYALLTPRETQLMDERVAASLGLLMHQAGLMVARTIRRYWAPCRVLVACGPGNNGGDGYVAAQFLQQWGWSVRTAALAPPKTGSLAHQVAEQWQGPRVPFVPEEAARVDLVVDAVFGAGMARVLPENVEAFFAAASHIVAVDLPSGVDGETGQCLGRVPSCDQTIALVRRRPGHCLSPGRDVCGDVVCVDIGMPSSAFHDLMPHYWENSPALWTVPPQQRHDHKYSRGVVSVCGGEQMPGAALLASEASRHVGAGLVRVSAAQEASAFYRIASPGVMSDSLLGSAMLGDKRRRVWVCGPGLTGEEVEKVFPLLVQSGCSIVADAGVLGWAATGGHALHGVDVMTPHAGEFEKLFGPLKPNSVAAAQAAAEKTGSVIVLKGAETLIVAPDGRVTINHHASPSLATAGSGDVLSGVIGALLAAKMPPYDASCAGVWIHGEASLQARAVKGEWLIAEDIIACLGAARQKASGTS